MNRRISELLRAALVVVCAWGGAVTAAPAPATKPSAPATRPAKALSPEEQKLVKLRDLSKTAVLALEGRKLDAAETALVEALVIDPDNYTNVYNMACLRALQGKSDDALAYLERAADAGFTDFVHLERDPDLNSLRELARYKKLVANRDVYQKKDADRALASLKKQFGDKYLYEVDSPNKLVYVANTDAPTLAAVKKWLTAQAKSQWAELFDNKPDEYIVILLPSAADYKKLIRQPGVEGVYMPQARTLIARRLGQVMTHEFTHAMHAGDLDKSKQEHPIWVIEGIASMYEAGQFEGERLVPRDNYRLWFLQSAHKSGRLIPLEKLIKMEQDELVKNATLGYGQSSSVMLYLYDQGLLKPFYQAFKAGLDKDPTGKAALEKVSGKPLKQFEKEWQAWMARRNPPAMSTGPDGAFLGVRFSQENDGLKIDEVVANGPAAKAGIKQADVIVGLGETDVRDQMSLMPMLKELQPGESVKFKVRRGQAYLDIAVTLGKRDDAAPARRPEVPRGRGRG